MISIGSWHTRYTCLDMFAKLRLSEYKIIVHHNLFYIQHYSADNESMQQIDWSVGGPIFHL